MPYAVENSQGLGKARMHWMLRVRGAALGHPTFVFFPHAGATPLCIGRLAAALPSSVGVAVASLPRGGDLDDGTPPRRVGDAAQEAALGLMALLRDSAADTRLVLVGNSYGALLAYETAWRLVQAQVPVERLVVSGFRSPALPMADTPLYRLPLPQLRAELSARFGAAPDSGAALGDELGEQALRADLQACDTYRHQQEALLPIPIDVLHLTGDSSVSVDELRAWKMVTGLSMRFISSKAGHFPWTEYPDAMARTLLQLAGEPTHAHAGSPSTLAASYSLRET
ncbi:MAG: alpha/beta fold hydrolase [Pusillimonas sp.]